MWNDMFQKLIRRNFLVEISPPENFGKRNYWVDIYHRGIKSPPTVSQRHFPDKMSVSRSLLQKSQNTTFPYNISDFGTPASQSATFPRETSPSHLSKCHISRRLKVLHFLGRSMIFPLWPSHPEVSKCCISYGNLWFWDSGPVCPASESAISHREIYNFGTLALSSRRLKSAAFPWETSPPLPSLEVTHFPEKHLCF